MSSNDVIVRVNGLGKCFKLYDNPLDRLKDWGSFGRTRRWTDYWALKDVSFEVRRGECFGVIGENGAGKSTLLKILTGAMYASEGEVEVKGRVLSLLELGTGFSPELTGRQNIHNSASLLGFPQDYVNAERLKQIEEFADIGEFFDHPVRMYSSGMYVRLAFAMFMFMEPDLFIIDEALSVGDIFFSQKCFTKIRELMSAGVTFIFVSHDLNAVSNLSHKVMLLKNGKKSYIGPADQAISRYWALGRTHKQTVARDVIDSSEPTVSKRFIMDPSQIAEHSILKEDKNEKIGDGAVEIIAVRVTDKNGLDTLSVPMGDDLYFYIHARANWLVERPNFGITFNDRMNNYIFANNTHVVGGGIEPLSAGAEAVVALKVKMDIQAGQYTFQVGCASVQDGVVNAGILHSFHQSQGPITVNFDYTKDWAPFLGMAKLKMEILY